MKFNASFVWALAQRAGPQCVTFLFLFVLAKFLGPQEFGLLALAQIWLGGFRVVGDAGLSSTVIQAQALSGSQLSSVFFLNLGMFLVLALLSCTSIWAFPLDSEMAELPLVVMALSLTLPISGMSVTQLALAYRGMRFRFLAFRDLFAALAGGGAGIAAAINGWGVWALVLQALVFSLVNVMLLWRGSDWSPKISEFSLAGLRPLLNFSLWILAFQVFSYAVKEVDKTLIGVLVGISTLGIYALANKAILLPTLILSDALNTYLFPKMSSLQASPDGLRNIYAGSISLTMCLALPLTFTLGMALHLYGAKLLGAQWSGVEELAPYIAIVAACQSYISPAGSALKAMGRASLLFKWAVFFVCLVVAGVLAGSPHGIIGIAIGVMVANVIGTAAISLVMRRILSVELAFLGVFYVLVTLGLAFAAMTIYLIDRLSIQRADTGLLVIIGISVLYLMAITRFEKIDIAHYFKLT